MRITIIEDKEDLAEWIAKKLSRNGYSVNIHNNLASFLKSPLWETDLYISDMSLWDWEGYDVIKRIRKFEKTPILIISWYCDRERVDRCRKLWANKYLPKPFSPLYFIEVVWKLINK